MCLKCILDTIRRSQNKLWTLYIYETQVVMANPKGATLQDQLHHLMRTIGSVAPVSSHKAPAAQKTANARKSNASAQQKQETISQSLMNSLRRVNGHRALARGDMFHHLEPADMSKYAKATNQSKQQHTQPTAHVPVKNAQHKALDGHLRPAHDSKTTKRSIYNMNNNNSGMRLARHVYDSQHGFQGNRVDKIQPVQATTKHPNHAIANVSRSGNKRDNQGKHHEFSFVLPPSAPALSPFRLPPKIELQHNKKTDHQNTKPHSSHTFLNLTPEEKAEVERLAREQFMKVLGPKNSKVSTHVMSNAINHTHNKNHNRGNHGHDPHLGRDAANLAHLHGRKDALAEMNAIKRQIANSEVFQKALQKASKANKAKRGLRVSGYPPSYAQKRLYKRMARSKTPQPAPSVVPKGEWLVQKYASDMYKKLHSTVSPYAQLALQKVNPKHLLGVGRRVRTVEEGNHPHIIINANDQEFYNADSYMFDVDSDISQTTNVHKQSIKHHS